MNRPVRVKQKTKKKSRVECERVEMMTLVERNLKISQQVTMMSRRRRKAEEETVNGGGR